MGCNQNSGNASTLALTNSQNQIVVESEDNFIETFKTDNQLSDCNKPKNDDESLLCAAITKDIDKKIIAELTEELYFVSRRVDLNGDGRDEVFVWIPTRNWGGSSGYPIIIFSKTQKGYRKLWEVDQAWTPIILLKSKSYGWQDFSFQFGGGGVDWQYVVLQYNGKSYKYSPIDVKQPQGEIVIDKDFDSTVFGPILKR